MHKVPFNYHLKKMTKSNSVEDSVKHFEHFVTQSVIQGTFTVQKMINDLFDCSRKLLIINY